MPRDPPGPDRHRLRRRHDAVGLRDRRAVTRGEAAETAIEETTGSRPELSTSGGTSDGRFIAPYGVQVVELGPVNATIHKVDECIEVDDIMEFTLQGEPIFHGDVISPPADPSERYRRRSWRRVFAEKKTSDPSAVMKAGYEPSGPRTRSMTRLLSPSSNLHSSVPVVPSLPSCLSFDMNPSHTRRGRSS